MAKIDRKISEIDYKSTWEWLAIGEFTIHPKIQRKFDQAHCNHLMSTFNIDALPPIAVVPRPKGGYWVIDGQHSLAAAKEVLSLDAKQQLFCRVYHAESEADAANLCLALNDRKAWRTLQRFGQRITAKDPVALALVKIAGEFGYRVEDMGKMRGYITAVAALERIYKMDQGGHLWQTLHFVTEAWGNKDPDGVSANVLHGVTAVIKRDGKGIDKNFAHKLTKSLSSQRLIGDARALSRIHRCSVPQAIAVRLVQEYNVKRKTGRLKSWIE